MQLEFADFLNDLHDFFKNHVYLHQLISLSHSISEPCLELIGVRVQLMEIIDPSNTRRKDFFLMIKSNSQFNLLEVFERCKVTETPLTQKNYQINCIQSQEHKCPDLMLAQGGSCVLYDSVKHEQHQLVSRSQLLHM